ncbi:MAG: hypothetical protein SGPRY_005274 [Prymnesium sp.]
MEWVMQNPSKEDTPENRLGVCNLIGAEFTSECGLCKTPDPSMPPSPPSPPSYPPGMSWWSEYGSDAATAGSALVDEMTREQKLVFIEGVPEAWNDFTSTPGGIQSLGIPPMLFSDAQAGFSTKDPRTIGKVTMWPSMGALSATWSSQLAGEIGTAIGIEFRKKGANGLLVISHILTQTREAPYTCKPKPTENLPNEKLVPAQPLRKTGPGVDIGRVPVAGRNAESMCGEDANLCAPLAHDYILGVQSQGVAATIKHFVGNMQEHLRESVDHQIGDRTLFEVHYVPYEAAIRANVASVMCAYNRLNGPFACTNPELLQSHLKGYLGFNGWVMSDWWAMKGAIPGSPNGLDQNMPGTILNIDREQLSDTDLDQMVTRILRSMIKVGAWDWEEGICLAPEGQNCEQTQFEKPDATSAEHTALARQIASEGVLLLQNDGTLPLQATASQLLHIALVGSMCDAQSLTYPTSHWYDGDYYVIGGSSRVLSTPEKVVTIKEGLQSMEHVKLTISSDDSVEGAIDAIRTPGVDVVIACGGVSSGEFVDRKNLEVDQHSFIVGLAAANAAATQPLPLVVVTIASGTIVTDFRTNATSHLHLFQSGQETGNAVADVLFGVVNPSGKSPVTFPLSADDALPPCPINECPNSENLFVGWKAYLNREVAYPFGHGLSYTKFAMRMEAPPKLEQDESVILSVDVLNSGAVAGKTVVQVYLTFPNFQAIEEPELVLRKYQKTPVLQPGGSVKLDFTLSSRDMSIWKPCTFDANVQNTNAPCADKEIGWFRPAGMYTIVSELELLQLALRPLPGYQRKQDQKEQDQKEQDEHGVA